MCRHSDFLETNWGFLPPPGSKLGPERGTHGESSLGTRKGVLKGGGASPRNPSLEGGGELKAHLIGDLVTYRGVSQGDLQKEGFPGQATSSPNR